jgi:hypothetical protein
MIKEFLGTQSRSSRLGGAKMGLPYAPYMFTEQGVAMLSTVLKSERAILIFTALKQLLNRPEPSRRMIGFKAGEL